VNRLKKKSGQEKTQRINTKVNINLDSTPILYTDNVLMNINDNGVTLDITQRIVTSNKLRVVSRVGMSREYVRKFIDKLGKLLVLSEGKSKAGGGLVN
jgi:hypothetical protein